MRIPRFLRRETRSGGFTSLVLRGLDASVAGSDVDASVSGALEVAAGMWGRVLAAADVSGTTALDPETLQLIGRQLIRVGEVVLEVRNDGGAPVLVPATSFEVLEGWRYKLDFTEPQGRPVQRTVPRRGVLHAKWAYDPREPWRGMGPLDAPTALAKSAGRVETRLADELNSPVAHILPMPADGQSPEVSALRSDLGAAKGEAYFVESNVASVHDPRAAPRHDWRPERLGPAIPDSSLGAYGEIAARVWSACGIPPGLAGGLRVDGTLARENYRRWVMASVEPVAKVLAVEASRALGESVSFSFQGLWAHDLQGRAAAFQRLVAGGMDPERAVRLSGLLVED